MIRIETPRSWRGSLPGGGAARMNSAAPSCSWRLRRLTTCMATCWRSMAVGWRDRPARLVGGFDLSDLPTPGAKQFGVVDDARVGIVPVDQFVDGRPGEAGVTKSTAVRPKVDLAAPDGGVGKTTLPSIADVRNQEPVGNRANAFGRVLLSQDVGAVVCDAEAPIGETVDKRLHLLPGAHESKGKSLKRQANA